MSLTSMKVLTNGSFAIPSKIMPCQSHPVSLEDQNEIPVDLLC